MKVIIVEWILLKEDTMFRREMRVVKSDHERFIPGSRFDFGFFTIATIEGYTIISLPTNDLSYHK